MPTKSGARGLSLRPALPCARSAHGVEEAERTVDLHALLDSIACDCADAGRPVRLSGPVGTTAATRHECTHADHRQSARQRAQIRNRRRDRVAREAKRATGDRDTRPGTRHTTGALDAVFEPFHRIESSRSRETGGTGLGLAIARKLAKSIGAEIRLMNRPGGGLEARVTLSSEVN